MLSRCLLPTRSVGLLNGIALIVMIDSDKKEHENSIPGSSRQATMPKPNRRFTPRSRSDWRRWLSVNHDRIDVVWLVFYKKHVGKPTLSYNDAVEEGLCFGWIDGMKKRIDDERYMHRFTPRKSRSRWSETNVKRAQRLLASGEMTHAGQRVIDEAKRSGTWNWHPDATRFEMAPAFSTALGTHPDARAFWNTLAPSYQYQFIVWIGIAKREVTRNRRIAESLELLRRGERLGMR